MFRKFILIFCITIISGCTKQTETYDMYGPDYYTVECRGGQVWIVSKHGKFPLGDKCNE